MDDADLAQTHRLISETTGLLDPAGLWLIVACVPARKVGFADVAESAQQWLVDHVAAWPAPLGIGERAYAQFENRVIFSSVGDGGPAKRHCADLRTDGATAVAVQIGERRESPDGAGVVWGIGEGALAWLTVALVRLVADWALSSGVPGRALLEARVVPAEATEEVAELQIWSFASGVNAPVGEKLRAVIPSRASIDLADCISGRATSVARSLLLPLLQQFGLNESRHIDAAGTIDTANFASHSPVIAAWARTIGAAHR